MIQNFIQSLKPIIDLDAHLIGGANNSNVSKWLNTTNKVNCAEQTNVANQPVLKTNVLNGYNVVEFDPTTTIKYMPILVDGSNNLSLPVGYTQIIVFRLLSTTYYNPLLTKTVGNVYRPIDYYTLPSESKFRFALNAPASSIDCGINNFNIFVLRSTGASGVNSIKINTNAFENASVPAYTDNGQLIIGSRQDLFTKLHGQIAKILMYNKPLTDTQINHIVNILKRRFNI